LGNQAHQENEFRVGANKHPLAPELMCP
jgi:hypothetical protein